MKYIDSNVFIFAALPGSKKEEKARAILSQIANGQLMAATSALVIDEFVWMVWKETKNRDFAIGLALNLLELKNLKFIVNDQFISKRALLLMKKYPHLKPRDGMHMAAALASGSKIIISDDADFDNLEEIKRESLD